MHKIVVSRKLTRRILYLSLLDLLGPMHSVIWLKSVDLRAGLRDLNFKIFLKRLKCILLLYYSHLETRVVLSSHQRIGKGYFCTCIFNVWGRCVDSLKLSYAKSSLWCSFSTIHIQILSVLSPPAAHSAGSGFVWVLVSFVCLF